VSVTQTAERAAAERLVEWFRAEGVDLPWRRTRDRWAVLVSEFQLQATPVDRVLPRYRHFMDTWPTPAAMAAAPLGEVLSRWQGLGYPRRARNLHAAARIIASGGWPAADRLTDLPGVGPYTAAAVRCFAGGEDLLPVDTNVARVLVRRFPGGWPGAPGGAAWEAGQGFMDLGRLWCTARRPRCDDGCPLRPGCPAADAGQVRALTPPRRRQAPYPGSMRQRRGRLLRRLAEDGWAELDADRDAATSLLADGLADRAGGRLVPAGAGG
jgi:A/G-specific adenine glycosylase